MEACPWLVQVTRNMGVQDSLKNFYLQTFIDRRGSFGFAFVYLSPENAVNSFSKTGTYLFLRGKRSNAKIAMNAAEVVSLKN